MSRGIYLLRLVRVTIQRTQVYLSCHAVTASGIIGSLTQQQNILIPIKDRRLCNKEPKVEKDSRRDFPLRVAQIEKVGDAENHWRITSAVSGIQ
jgi:hypothetical protein